MTSKTAGVGGAENDGDENGTAGSSIKTVVGAFFQEQVGKGGAPCLQR